MIAAPLAAAENTAIAQGDALYPQRMELARDKEALSDYEKALAADPKNIEALWKASRAAWWSGTQSKDRGERLDYFKKGIALSSQALQLDPKSVEAHFWLGGNYASYGHVKGCFTSLYLIRSIRREMNEVITLNPAYMGGGADRILGIMDYKIPSLVGGDPQRGLKHLERSLELDPTNPVTLFYLADYYADQSDKANAKLYLDRLQKTHPSAEFLPEFPQMLEQGRELAAKLKA